MDQFSEYLKNPRFQEGSLQEPKRDHETIYKAFEILEIWVKVSRWADYPTDISSQSAF
jgi:hypothetical protein